MKQEEKQEERGSSRALHEIKENSFCGWFGNFNVSKIKEFAYFDLYRIDSVINKRNLFLTGDEKSFQFFRFLILSQVNLTGTILFFNFSDNGCKFKIK